MGMFDTFYYKKGIECPCGLQVHEFQGKDLDCLMDWFQILEDGTLEVENYKLHIIPENERQSAFPIFKKEILGFSPVFISKTLNIYSSCPTGKHWIDLYLNYWDGELLHMKENIEENI